MAAEASGVAIAEPTTVRDPRSTTTVTLLVNPALRARLEEAAELNERSLGGQVRAILREYFEEGDEA